MALDGTTILDSKPPRLHLQDLVTLERLDAQFNPASVEDILHVEWVKQKIPGLSHRKLQYDYTDNQKFSLELIFDSFFTKDLTPLQEAKQFIHSLCYLKAKGQTSRVLVVWPGFFSLVCVIDGDVKTKTTRFNMNGQPTYITMTIPLTEIRDSRITSEDVRSVGLIRSTTGAEIPDGSDQGNGNIG
jgi:hypothetical protein